jgi:TfoX/Sxy family transcriptional regulator of competence genes
MTWTTIQTQPNNVQTEQNLTSEDIPQEEWTTTFNDNDEIIAKGDKSFIDRMQESFYKRVDKVQKSREMFANKEITLPEHVFHSYAQGGMLLLDTAGNAIIEGVQETWDALDYAENGLRWIMPDGMEETLDNFDKRTANNLTKWWENSPSAEAARKAATSGAGKYKKWAKENPRAAANFESVVDIALIFATPGRLIPWKGKEKTVFKTTSDNQFYLAGQQATRNKYDKLWTQLHGKDRINEKNISRVTVDGLSRTQTINYNAFEKELMDTLFSNGVTKKNRPSQNSEAMTKGINKWGSKLRLQITQAGGGSQKPVPWTEVKSTLEKNIDELIESNPIFAEASQQATIRANLQRLQKLIDDNNFKGNPLGIFELRQAYDDFVRSTAKAGSLDGSVNKTAMDESVRVIRTTLNDIVAAKLPNTPVKESLRTQSLLYEGRSLILPAVQLDAKHAIQNAWKNIANAIHVKMDYNRIMAVAFGGSAYGAAAMTGASAIAAVGIGGTALFAAVAIQSRATKIALGQTLKYMDQVIGMPGANPNVVKALSADRAIIKELFQRPIENQDKDF